MSKEKLDIVGIGDAIVDISSQIDDAFLLTNKINKGIMTPVNVERTDTLCSKMKSTTVISGGSVANTVVAFASFGGNAGYIGKVAKDQFGKTFRDDIRSTGVVFDTPPLQTAKVPTSRSIIMVTPDAQRTMCTFIGASSCFELMDFNEEIIKNAKVTYLEGYLLNHSDAMKSLHRVKEISHAAGNKVALTLSDSFCVDSHRDDFLELIKDHVDILFGNEAEIQSLYGTDKSSEIPLNCELTVITKGAEGSTIISKDGIVDIKTIPVAQIVDTTGAGDSYAAGFLYGYTQNKSIKECGHIASVAAAEIISQVGARPQKSLAQLLQDGKKPEPIPSVLKF